MSKDTKGNHSTTSEDSLVQDSSKEHYETMNKLAARHHERGHTISEMREQITDLKKENVELQHTLSVHNFLDTGVPQERLDYQRDLKKEIIKLRSLCRRASEKIRYLDDMIIKSIEDNKVIEYPEEDKTDSAGF